MQAQGIRNTMPMVGASPGAKRDYVILTGSDPDGRDPVRLVVGDQVSQINKEEGGIIARGLQLKTEGLSVCVEAKIEFSNGESQDISVEVLEVC